MTWSRTVVLFQLSVRGRNRMRRSLVAAINNGVLRRRQALGERRAWAQAPTPADVRGDAASRPTTREASWVDYRPHDERRVPHAHQRWRMAPALRWPQPRLGRPGSRQRSCWQRSPSPRGRPSTRPSAASARTTSPTTEPNGESLAREQEETSCESKSAENERVLARRACTHRRLNVPRCCDCAYRRGHNPLC